MAVVLTLATMSEQLDHERAATARDEVARRARRVEVVKRVACSVPPGCPPPESVTNP